MRHAPRTRGGKDARPPPLRPRWGRRARTSPATAVPTPAFLLADGRPGGVPHWANPGGPFPIGGEEKKQGEICRANQTAGESAAEAAGPASLRTALMDAGGNGFGGNALTGGLSCHLLRLQPSDRFLVCAAPLCLREHPELEARFILRRGAQMFFQSHFVVVLLKEKKIGTCVKRCTGTISPV